ncbi:DUF1125 domain-containing protein [Lactococcus taiwanensis]|uniref:DUF1125 domain-containing protein n=1 Tax=Lactococcus taiwanensis TaxID=1151742 RepID=UPI001964B0A5|nr:DUF1125 domain-containing protein [Lactococcus taiwanensis]QRZ11748.1 DUF1125 domain-containing protein [Lactococcus taiwanensis]
MTVESLLKTIQDPAVITFVDKENNELIVFEYGNSIGVFNVGFLWRKIATLTAKSNNEFEAILEDRE